MRWSSARGAMHKRSTSRGSSASRTSSASPSAAICSGGARTDHLAERRAVIDEMLSSNRPALTPTAQALLRAGCSRSGSDPGSSPGSTPSSRRSGRSPPTCPLARAAGTSCGSRRSVPLFRGRGRRAGRRDRHGAHFRPWRTVTGPWQRPGRFRQRERPAAHHRHAGRSRGAGWRRASPGRTIPPCPTWPLPPPRWVSPSAGTCGRRARSCPAGSRRRRRRGPGSRRSPTGPRSPSRSASRTPR